MPNKMAKVTISYKPSLQQGLLIQWMRENLRNLVAKHLSGDVIQGLALVYSDVELKFEPYGPYDITGEYDFQVEIRTVHKLDRKIYERGVRAITQEISSECPSITDDKSTSRFYIWYEIGQGFFAQGQSGQKELGPLGQALREALSEIGPDDILDPDED